MQVSAFLALFSFWLEGLSYTSFLRLRRMEFRPD